MTATSVKFPKTIGLVMDGNRRWARSKGLHVFKGHEAGYEKLKQVVRWAKARGISSVYAYAFSTENWNRSKDEVGYLMELLSKVVGEEARNLIKEKVRVKFVGQTERFSPVVRMGMKALEKATAKFTGTTLLLCLSYGGRTEILNAVKEYIKKTGGRGVDKLDEKIFEKYLWTAGFPDPELIIRTSGEIRTSNFLPWQSAYSEWFFTKTFWPAFTEREFERILKEFSRREIRKGK